MTIYETTGLTPEQINKINSLYSVPVRYIQQQVTVGSWSPSDSGRIFNPIVTINSGISELRVASDCAGFPLGKSVCQTLNMKFFNKNNWTENKLKRCVLKIEAGISEDRGQTYTFTEIGYFYPSAVESADNWKTISIEAFDDMDKLNEKKTKVLSVNGTAFDIFSSIWSGAASFASVLKTFPITVSESKILSKYSAREALGFIGMRERGFFKIDRFGKLRFCTLSLNPNYFNADGKDKLEFKKDEVDISIGSIKAGLRTDYKEYVDSEDETCGCFSCPLTLSADFAENLFNEIYTVTELFENVGPGVYSIGKLTTRGNPSIEIGQVLNFYNTWNQPQRIIVSGITYDLAGGRMDFISVSPDDDLIYGSNEPATESYVDEKIEEALFDSNYEFMQAIERANIENGYKSEKAYGIICSSPRYSHEAEYGEATSNEPSYIAYSTNSDYATLTNTIANELYGTDDSYFVMYNVHLKKDSWNFLNVNFTLYNRETGQILSPDKALISASILHSGTDYPCERSGDDFFNEDGTRLNYKKLSGSSVESAPLIFHSSVVKSDSLFEYDIAAVKITVKLQETNTTETGIIFYDNASSFRIDRVSFNPNGINYPYNNNFWSKSPTGTIQPIEVWPRYSDDAAATGEDLIWKYNFNVLFGDVFSADYENYCQVLPGQIILSDNRVNSGDPIILTAESLKKLLALIES